MIKVRPVTAAVVARSVMGTTRLPDPATHASWTSLAQNETVVSSTIKDPVIGSDIAFDDRGSHHLKGIEGQWQLYSVVPGRSRRF